MDKRKELLQAAIARCQELQKENPTGQLVYDDELTGILQELLDLKKEENAANGVSQHLVGYIGITVPGEPEICAPYIPDVEIDWDNAMIPSTPAELTMLQTKGRGLRDDKPQIQFDHTKSRIEDVPDDFAERAAQSAYELTWLYPHIQVPVNLKD